jgi:hypothetical protein
MSLVPLSLRWLLESRIVTKILGIDQIPAELIIEGVRAIFSEITQHLNSIWNNEDMLEEWKESIIVPIS